MEEEEPKESKKEVTDKEEKETKIDQDSENEESSDDDGQSGGLEFSWAAVTPASSDVDLSLLVREERAAQLQFSEPRREADIHHTVSYLTTSQFNFSQPLDCSMAETEEVE